MRRRQHNRIGRIIGVMRRWPDTDPALVLLAAIVAQAMEDARRGSIEARDWLREAGF